MKREYFFSFLGIFILLIYNFYHYQDSNKEISPGESFVHKMFKKAKKQKTDKIVVDTSLTLVNEMEIENFVLKPLLLQVDQKQNIFVLDRYQQKIYGFQNGSKTVVEIGHGKGQGPKEFLNITDFRVKK